MDDNKHDTETFTFETSLDDGDWGLIISAEGDLKGLFIPEGSEEDQVPESIVHICEEYFGVDLSQGDQPKTLH
jgi:hypothetical protein